MAAAGEKTLAHSRNHVTDLSTESGNLFKMAGKDKDARIWVRDLDTGGKQSKWRQRRTRCAHGKKLKITMNTRTSASHRNTVEGYLDKAILFCCSMTFFLLNLKVLTCTALDNLTWFLVTALFSLLFLASLRVPEVFSSLTKTGTFFQPWAQLIDSLFYPRNFENGPLEPGYLFSWHLKLLPSEIQPRIYWFVDTKSYRQFCYRYSWGFWQ